MRFLIAWKYSYLVSKGRFNIYYNFYLTLNLERIKRNIQWQIKQKYLNKTPRLTSLYQSENISKGLGLPNAQLVISLLLVCSSWGRVTHCFDVDLNGTLLLSQIYLKSVSFFGGSIGNCELQLEISFILVWNTSSQTSQWFIWGKKNLLQRSNCNALISLRVPRKSLTL